jgi:excisionase family DNA binding protein
MAAQHSQEPEPTSHPAGLADPDPVDSSPPAPGPRAVDDRPPRFLTVAEVAALLRVSTMTVYRQIQAGELAAVRVGKSYRLRADDVDEWIAECVVPPTD